MQDLVGKKTRVLYYQWTENSISMFNSSRLFSLAKEVIPPLMGKEPAQTKPSFLFHSNTTYALYYFPLFYELSIWNCLSPLPPTIIVACICGCMGRNQCDFIGFYTCWNNTTESIRSDVPYLCSCISVSLLLIRFPSAWKKEPCVLTISQSLIKYCIEYQPF